MAGVNAPKRRFLAAACDDGILKLWSLQNGKLLISWKGDDMDVAFVLFTPDARTLISNGILPPIIKLWDVAKWTQP
jgi:WD40 repeat protein